MQDKQRILLLRPVRPDADVVDMKTSGVGLNLIANSEEGGSDKQQQKTAADILSARRFR